MGFRVTRIAGRSRERPGATDTHAGTVTIHGARAYPQAHPHARTHAGTADTHAGSYAHAGSYPNTSAGAHAGTNAHAVATYSGTAQALRGGAPPDQSQRGSRRA